MLALSYSMGTAVAVKLDRKTFFGIGSLLSLRWSANADRDSVSFLAFLRLASAQFIKVLLVNAE